MRSLTVAAVVAVSLLSSTAALAGPTKSKSKIKSAKEKKIDAAMVASAEPLPQLPPPVAEPAAPPPAAPAVTTKDAPAAKPLAGERPSAGAGFVLVIGSGAGFLGGKIAKDIDVAAGLVTFDLKLGAYVTRHFGIMAGVQGAYGALFDGCAGTCSNAYHYQLPILAQYAFDDRSRGVYVEGGLGLFSTLGASTDTKANPDESPETLTVSAPVDLKLGIGYRIPAGPTDKAATSALDLRFGADLGQFKHVDYRTVVGNVVGDIASDRQATHFTLGLSVGYHFAP